VTKPLWISSQCDWSGTEPLLQAGKMCSVHSCWTGAYPSSLICWALQWEISEIHTQQTSVSVEGKDLPFFVLLSVVRLPCFAGLQPYERHPASMKWLRNHCCSPLLSPSPHTPLCLTISF